MIYFIAFRYANDRVHYESIRFIFFTYYNFLGIIFLVPIIDFINFHFDNAPDASLFFF